MRLLACTLLALAGGGASAAAPQPIAPRYLAPAASPAVAPTSSPEIAPTSSADDDAPASTPPAAASPAPPDPARAALNARVFDRAWSLVRDRYFDVALGGVNWSALRSTYRPEALAAPDDATLYRALNQLLAKLRDRHVFALSPQVAADSREERRLDTGLRARQLGAAVVVTEVIAASPAARAGVQPGWRIVTRDGRTAAGDTLADTLEAYTGQPIDLLFADRDERARALRLVPELLTLDSLRYASTALPGGIHYLRFDHFDSDASAWLERELATHRNTPALILDLRYNIGGHESSLRRTVRAFFPRRQDMGHTLDRGGAARPMQSYASFPATYSGRLIVLTGGVTASCAEIFAHTLQYHRRATLVGQPTAGAVTGAALHRLPDGGYLGLAEMDFIGLDGRRLEGTGVTPDVLVPFALADLRSDRDAALAAAVHLLQNPVTTVTAPKLMR